MYFTFWFAFECCLRSGDKSLEIVGFDEVERIFLVVLIDDGDVFQY